MSTNLCLQRPRWFICLSKWSGTCLRAVKNPHALSGPNCETVTCDKMQESLLSWETHQVDRRQSTRSLKNRDGESLNKTTLWCAENGHKIPNTLNISHLSPSDKYPSDRVTSGPPSEFYAWSRIIPMWQLPRQNSSSLSFKRQRGTFISMAYRLSHSYMTLVYCRQGNIPSAIRFNTFSPCVM